MTKEKLEDISLDKLRKRKKVSIVLLCVLIGAAILNIIILFRDFIGEKQLDTSLLLGAFTCLTFGTYFFLGIRKINGEICRRKNK